MAGHFNFYRDKNVKRLQPINRDLSQFDCLPEKIRADLIMIFSQFSPVLAAEALRLHECHQLQSFGMVSYLSRCKSINVRIGGKLTTCGTESFFQIGNENFTLANDGTTVKKFNFCYRQPSLMLIRNQLFEWGENHWFKLTLTFHALQQHSHAVFTPIIDKSEMTLLGSVFKTFAEIFTMLKKLNGLMNEKGEKLAGLFVINTIQQASVRHSV